MGCSECVGVNLYSLEIEMRSIVVYVEQKGRCNTWNEYESVF
jgi:hypothetical protein